MVFKQSLSILKMKKINFSISILKLEYLLCQNICSSCSLKTKSKIYKLSDYFLINILIFIFTPSYRSQ